jgi:type VI secretion system (T6SS) amidase immunity protein Tai4
MMGKKTFLIVALLAQQPPSKPALRYDEAGLLRNYALSQCVAHAYTAGEVVEDARAAAGAYLEQGHVEPAAYEATVKIVEKQLKQSYPGKSGKQLQLMKCIDLLHGSELKGIVSHYAVQKH